MTARCNAISTTLGALCCATALVCLAGCTESAPPVPDLSGTWGRNYFDLEPPLSGPGPIGELMKAGFASVRDYTNPILKPGAAEIVKKRGEIELSGRYSPTAHNQCWPEAAPDILYQLGVQVLQQRNQVTLLYLSNHQVRRVRMNEPHRTGMTPSWWGDSVGYYEGDTLVIDTIGQKVGPLSTVDGDTPFSAQLHVIERYRLIDGETAREIQQKQESKEPGLAEELKGEYGRGDIDPDPQKKGLQVEITVEDPVMFTTRWSGLVTYRRVLGEWPEAVCAENMREFGPERKPPMDETPDF